MVLSGGGGNGPGIVISSPNPPSGPAGARVVVSGSHWVPGTTVTLSIGTASGSCDVTTVVDGASGTVDNTGAVEIAFTWPNVLAYGTYPVCASGPGAPSGGIKSSNSFTELTQATPSINLPGSAVSGQTIAVTGNSWQPGGAVVEIHGGPQGGDPCAQLLATLTSGNNGFISGTITVPTVSSNTTYVITATSPAGTCSGSPAPTMHASATLPIAPSGNGATTPTPAPTATNTPHPGGTSTPTPHPGTPTPAPGSGTPHPGQTQVPEPNGTPTPHPGATATPHPGGGGGSSSSSGPCPPLPSGYCSPGTAFPWWLLCLIVFGLLALFLILLLLLLWRRNQEVVNTEEDITSQINPATVAPMGTMRFVRAVRVTTQVVDVNTGAVRSSRTREYDEFVDANGNLHRRPR